MTGSTNPSDIYFMSRYMIVINYVSRYMIIIYFVSRYITISGDEDKQGTVLIE